MRGRRGQHTAEFAILLALAATVAIGMQLYVRRAIQVGMAGASNTILGKPTSSSSSTTSPSPAPSSAPCDPLALAVKSDPSVSLCVTTAAGSDEIGLPGKGVLTRVTTSVSGITGHSVNREVRLRIIPETGLTDPNAHDEPGPDQ